MAGDFTPEQLQSQAKRAKKAGPGHESKIQKPIVHAGIRRNDRVAAEMPGIGGSEKKRPALYRAAVDREDDLSGPEAEIFEKSERGIIK